MKVLLALDQGTTSSRAVVINEDAQVLGVAQQELTMHYPKAGWVEQDPREIWSTQLATARAALEAAEVTAADVAAIGITNQRETTLIWDRTTGEPLHNAIVWQDRRTAAICDRLRNQGVEPLITGRTGLLIDPYFSGTKLTWLLDHVEGARARAEAGQIAFGTVDSWLIWNLTGGRIHATDVTNASRTLLFNIHTRDWDDKLLQLLRIPRAMLAKVVDSAAVCGETVVSALGASIPIAGIGGDQQAALFGQQCVRAGMVKSTYGTGGFMLMHTGERPVESKSRLLTTVAWKLGERLDYALEGSVFVAGGVVQWLRDGLKIIQSSSQVNELAASVRDNGGIYFVPAFVGLGAPHWDPFARGTVIGLTGGSRAGHLARAALESIAFQTADVLQAMQSDSGIGVAELRVDGGASQSDLLMQFQADVLGVPVLRPKNYESTALGAAYLAGLAVGYWADPAVLAQHWRLERCFEPEMPAAQADVLRSAWREAVMRSRGWAYASHGTG
ncbi:MAG: glycerol kinase GlpK [Betaproteobacteria bacterium]|jgi:glycerol kinase|nr:MAG: glycerol kinase GlpK [Betaproteobacteria bacterium]